tara:strand:+ start:3082 stop:3414 length:333 start_codon:yes stop_codon:yes gene_type:complete
MTASATKVAQFKWGPGGRSRTTDASEFKLTERSNGDLTIIRQDIGPETKKYFGAYDFEQSMSIAADDRTLFVAMLPAHAVGGEVPLNWEQLQDLCKESDVPFVLSERALP